MSWIRNWKRACAGAVAKGMRTVEDKCGVGGLNNDDNACVTLGTDGTWTGASRAVFPAWEYGEVTPGYTLESQPIYAFKWKADGSIEISFGELGNEPVTDTNIVIVRHLGFSAALTWDSDTSTYTGNNTKLTDYLLSTYGSTGEACFQILVIPDNFISYDFDLLRGTA